MPESHSIAGAVCARQHGHLLTVRDHVIAHLRQTRDDELREAAALIHDTVDHDGVIYTLGNGGSASAASHFACDLTHVQRSDRWRPRVWPLLDTAYLTAAANDIGYACVFSDKLEMVLRPADLVVCISVSGNSPNAIRAAEAATARGSRVLGVLGSDGGQVLQSCDRAIVVGCGHAGVVESVHLALLHELAEQASASFEVVPHEQSH